MSHHQVERKHRSRYQRDTANPPGLILQPRDIELLAFLSEVRFAVRDQLARMIFANTADYACKSRLQRLWQHGYLNRLFFPPHLLGLSGSIAGHAFSNGPTVYTLTLKGAETVALARDCSVRDVPYEAHANELSPSFILHELTLTDLRIAFARSGALQTWETTRQAADRYQLPHPTSGRMVTRHHAPDAYARLEIDGKTVHTFLEVDRGTESVRQRIRLKVESYRSYLGSGVFAERCTRSSSSAAARVLFVTTQTDKRVESLKLEAERASHSQRLFWFTTRTRLLAAADQLFTTPLWQRANDEGWRPFWVPAEQYFHELRPAVSQPSLLDTAPVAAPPSS